MPALSVQPPTEIAQPALPVAFDLGNYEAERAARSKLLDPRGCGGSPDEIVVCAPDQRKFRLRSDAALPDDPGFDVSVNVAPGMTLTPHLEAVGLPGGVQSNRVMVTFKLKL